LTVSVKSIELAEGLVRAVSCCDGVKVFPSFFGGVAGAGWEGFAWMTGSAWAFRLALGRTKRRRAKGDLDEAWRLSLREVRDTSVFVRATFRLSIDV